MDQSSIQILDLSHIISFISYFLIDGIQATLSDGEHIFTHICPNHLLAFLLWGRDSSWTLVDVEVFIQSTTKHGIQIPNSITLPISP